MLCLRLLYAGQMFVSSPSGEVSQNTRPSCCSQNRNSNPRKNCGELTDGKNWSLKLIHSIVPIDPVVTECLVLFYNWLNNYSSIHFTVPLICLCVTLDTLPITVTTSFNRTREIHPKITHVSELVLSAAYDIVLA